MVEYLLDLPIDRTSTVITLQSFIENLTTQALQIPQSVMRGYRPIHQVSVTL